MFKSFLAKSRLWEFYITSDLDSSTKYRETIYMFKKTVLKAYELSVIVSDLRKLIVKILCANQGYWEIIYLKL